MQRTPALSVAWRRSSQPSARPSHAASSRARSGRRPRQSFRLFVTALVCFVPRPRLSFRLCFRAASIGRTTSIDDHRPSVGRATHTSCLCLAANNSCSQGRWHPARRTEGAHSARARARAAGAAAPQRAAARKRPQSVARDAAATAEGCVRDAARAPRARCCRWAREWHALLSYLLESTHSRVRVLEGTACARNESVRAHRRWTQTRR